MEVCISLIIFWMTVVFSFKVCRSNLVIFRPTNLLFTFIQPWRHIPTYISQHNGRGQEINLGIGYTFSLSLSLISYRVSAVITKKKGTPLGWKMGKGARSAAVRCVGGAVVHRDDSIASSLRKVRVFCLPLFFSQQKLCRFMITEKFRTRADYTTIQSCLDYC